MLSLRWSIIVVAAFTVGGCGKPPPKDNLATYPVSGRVFYKGQPAEGAEVQLWAVGSDLKLAGACPHATVGADGSFKLTTYATGDGAPLGTYGVTVRWRLPPAPGKEEGPDRFQGRYADPLQALAQVQVSATDNELEVIHLQ